MALYFFTYTDKVGFILTPNRTKQHILFRGGDAPMSSSRRNNRGKKQVRSRVSSAGKLNPRIEDISVQDLLRGKQLEIVTAALLITGKLKVDVISVFRDSPVISVNLLGQFRTKPVPSDKSNALAQFLEENGDMTIDDIIDAISKRMSKRS